MSLTYGFCLGEISSLYDSAQFADAFHAVIGDGITPHGYQMAAAVNGFTVTIGTGYAFSAGRWLLNDEPLSLTVNGSGDHDDRTDAVVARVDYPGRRASLEVILGADPDKLPSELRSSEEYSIVLYIIHIRRGAASLQLGDITDLRANPDMCGTVLPLSAASRDVLYVYNFLQSGVEERIGCIMDLEQAAKEKAEREIAQFIARSDKKLSDFRERTESDLSDLNSSVQRLGGGPKLGDLRIACNPPGPRWLLCDGGAVPAEYPELSALLGGTLPNISKEASRYGTYIYAGDASKTAKISGRHEKIAGETFA